MLQGALLCPLTLCSNVSMFNEKVGGLNCGVFDGALKFSKARTSWFIALNAALYK